MDTEYINNRNKTKKIFNESLTKKTLIKTVISVGIITIVCNGLGFIYLMKKVKDHAIKNVRIYTEVVVKKESQIFLDSQKNNQNMKTFITQELGVNSVQDIEKFNKILVRRKDGTIRNLQPFDDQNTPGVFLGKNVLINDEMKERVIDFFHIVKSFGRAWENHFVNTYIQIPENGIVIYMPNYPWTEKATSDKIVTTDESFQITTKKNNPSRKTVWTSIYYDATLEDWMVSSVTPIDDTKGNHIGTIGHDILISELQKSTLEEKINGTENVIFDRNGRFIVHPDLMEEIKQSDGNITIDDMIKKTGNKTYDWSVFFELMKSIDLEAPITEGALLHSEKNQEYYVVSQIDGADWYWVTIVPQ
ncbi:cache domain-containing protein [Geminocystis sp. NIES-3709]|uniref:cache domain-containing protein n=1 Tax=Geminocystis sp. NIES-3709 TaxID=1617448 RepID=UPI0005FC58A5|nr:cache domain-containing protein [Geminocystis sp. NIES-3709]BAQ66125.1 diguanylate cyclase/phosphodiesterase with PAS/PAC sensor [Geminocystis sp. NIES-3709]